MRILYIDMVSSFSKIRIAEKTIFGKEFVALKNDVTILLRKNSKEQKKHKNLKIVYYKSNVFSKFFLNVPLLCKLNQLINKEHYDLIVSRNRLSISVIPLFIANLKNIPFVFIKAFPLTEQYYYLSKISNSIVNKYFLWFRATISCCFEKYVLRKADIIIPRTVAYMELLANERNVSRNKMFPLPMGFDDSYKKMKDSFNIIETKKKYSITNEKFIIHFGTFAKERNIEFILSVIKQISYIIPDVKLILVGGQREEIVLLKRTVVKLGLNKNVQLIETINRGELFQLLSLAYLSISAIPPISIYTISSPTKVIESLAFKVPVVVNSEILDQNEIVKKSGGGISVPYNIEDFKNAIIQLLETPEQKKTMGEKGAKYITENRTYSKMAKELNFYLLQKKSLFK